MSEFIRGSKKPVVSLWPNTEREELKPGAVRATIKTSPGGLTIASVGLASVMLAGGAHAQEAGALPEINVQGAQEGGYQTNRSSLTRLPTALRDTPQSVTVVPQQIIREQNATTVADALRNVAGVTFRAGEGGNQGDTPYIRGFDARNDIFRDGVRDPGWYTRDTFAVEQVEVFKGPSSFLFGRGSTGGVINLTTKTPQDRTFVEGEVIGTSVGGARASVDANGKLNDRWTARIQVMGQHYPVPGRDEVEDKRWGVAPSLSGKITDQTKVTFSHIYQHDNLIPDRGIPFLPATYGLPRVPTPVERSTFYGIINSGLGDTERVDANISTVKIEHELAPNAKITNTSRYVTVDRFNRATLTQAFNPPIGGLTTYSYRPPRQQLTVDNELLVNQTDFAGRFNTGIVQHNVTAGMEFAREERTQVSYAYVANSAGATSVFNPDPNRAPGSFGPAGVPTNVIGKTAAAYVADQMKITEWFELLGGLRYDNYESSSTSPTPLQRTDSLLSWRVGAVFHPVSNASIYVMRGTSFNPSAEFLTLTAANTSIGPEQNDTTEVGAKVDVLNGRLSLTTAWFLTDKTNARVPDPSNGTVNILDGVTRVTGWEFGINGRVTDRWQVFANFTNLTSEIVKTTTVAQLGKELIGTPNTAFSLWTTYDVNDKLTVGGGAYFVSDWWGDATNTALVPEYWRFDAMASYKVNRNTTLQLNVYNLTDKYYYSSAYSNWAIPGPSRYATLALRVRY